MHAAFPQHLKEDVSKVFNLISKNYGQFLQSKYFIVLDDSEQSSSFNGTSNIGSR